MRALIIDDDAALAAVFERCLTRWGWELDSSPTVARALDLFKRTSYDLALCDVDLPDGDGIALAQALLKVKPSLVVVIVSGSPDNLDRAREHGLKARLQKPFELDELKTLLEHGRSTRTS